MQISTVLFDLDGTLPPMDQDVFVKDYFGRIAAKLAPQGGIPFHTLRLKKRHRFGGAVLLCKDVDISTFGVYNAEVDISTSVLLEVLYVKPICAFLTFYF